MQKIDILIEKKEISKTIKKIAKKIIDRNKNKKELYFITVLIGAKTFAGDLIKEILTIEKFEIKNYEIKLSSYGNKTKTSGKINLVKDIDQDIKLKDLIIIEDIVDTGLTLNFLKDYLLNEKKAKSVKICSFLNKPSGRKINVKIDYVGYTVPDKFIVGYGIDYAGKYRDLDYIGVLKKTCASHKLN